jgi:hypothetical protein
MASQRSDRSSWALCLPSIEQWERVGNLGQSACPDRFDLFRATLAGAGGTMMHDRLSTMKRRNEQNKNEHEHERGGLACKETM